MVAVAEYLGQDVLSSTPIQPVAAKSGARCPFMDGQCTKVAQESKPVCSVRDSNGELWIVCRNRLCGSKKNKTNAELHLLIAEKTGGPVGSGQIAKSTLTTLGIEKGVGITDYQVEVLTAIGRVIFDSGLGADDLIFKREARIPVIKYPENSEENKAARKKRIAAAKLAAKKAGVQFVDEEDEPRKDVNYSADFVLAPRYPAAGMPRGSVVEMQGGGETSNTGQLTKHVGAWERDPARTNAMLAKQIKNVGTLETNAWRRQQEQFIVKGNVSVNSGGVMTFAVGRRFFDYLEARFEGQLAKHTIGNTKPEGWNLAIVTFDEAPPGTDWIVPNDSESIPLRVDPSRILFTDYRKFVEMLTRIGPEHPELFSGFQDSLAGPLPIQERQAVSMEELNFNPDDEDSSGDE